VQLHHQTRASRSHRHPHGLTIAGQNNTAGPLPLALPCSSALPIRASEHIVLFAAE
jgi:hypothetical protein